MIAAVRDPYILNYFGAHPEIACEIGGAIDFTDAIRETSVFLFGEHGGFCFEWSAPGTYEVHVMLTKAGRGRWGFSAALEARDKIAALGADRLWARIDPENRPLAWFTARAGFREVETRTLYSPAKVWRIFEWRKPCPQP